MRDLGEKREICDVGFVGSIQELPQNLSGASVLGFIGFSCVFKMIWDFWLLSLEINFNFKVFDFRV